MRKLETHIRAGNFSYLKTMGSSEISNVHVSNMIKRTLCNMKEPLIPFKFYDLFMKLDEIPLEKKLPYIIQQVDDLKKQYPLNHATLKFLCAFFKDLVSYEESNKMNANNISITVSPTIFRSREINPNELLTVAPLYDAMIRMIENFSTVFNQPKGAFGGSDIATAEYQDQNL